jgi:hypothetical protein
MSKTMRGPSRKCHGRTLVPEFCICPLQSHTQCPFLTTRREHNCGRGRFVLSFKQPSLDRVSYLRMTKILESA